MRPERRTRRLLALVVCATLGVTGIGIISSGFQASAVEIAPLPASGTVTVSGHGYGHGHGMSQYGARGAAIQGVTAARILAFYYPGTTLVTLPATTIRVGLSVAGTYTTVGGATKVTGYTGALTASTRYRLVPSGTGFQLQFLSGTAWKAVAGAPVLAARADFSGAAGYVRLYRSDGTSADYRGSVGAVRNGSGRITVNRLALDSYVKGVVPRELPSYWESAALQAQAIAARSYARNAVESHGSQQYDICDTEQCQVYGGLARYKSDGVRLFGEETSTNAAVAATANRVLQLNRATIFAQFSASSGGWTTDGGRSYLRAQADPYDNVASGDPYLNWTRTVRVADIARYYSLRTVTQIEITTRDGHGEWGGRVLAGYVNGIDGSGKTQHISTTGLKLQAAMGLPHNWFSIRIERTLGASTISPTSSSVAMFFRDLANQLQARTYVNGVGWQAPQNLGTPVGGFTWDPDAATWRDGHMDVAVRDATSHLAIRSYVPGTGWLPWRTYPQTMLSSPAAVSPTPNSLYVVYLGSGHTLWTTNWASGQGWTPARKIPGVANAASGPDAMAAVETTKDITIVYRGTDNRLWTVTRGTGSGWRTPAVVNPTRALPAAAAAVDPSVSNTGAGAPSVYYTAKNGVVYHAAYDVRSHAWSPWYAVPGSTSITGAPDVSNEGTGHVDVVAGSTGVLNRTSWTPATSWSRWAELR